MKIEGLPLESGGINTVTGKKNSKPASAETAQSTDSVALSSVSASEQAELSALTPEEFPVRAEALGTVAERVSRNYYDSPEVQESTAEQIVDSLNISVPVTDMENEAAGETVRSNTVEAVKVRIASGEYNTSETLTAVAESLTKALGLTSLLG